MWLLIAAYAFAVGWNVHEFTTPREQIIKVEVWIADDITAGEYLEETV
jgi:hypothetical protein